jgi:hypothetical protein
LRHVLNERARREKKFVLRDARVAGNGLSEDFADATWHAIRSASYAGRGG